MTGDAVIDRTMSSATPTAGAAVYSDGYKYAVLLLLAGANTVNFIDRTIVNVVGQAIKEDLQISDLQLGLLGGLAFAMLYTLLGIPIARLAERHNRVNIIVICLVAWSTMTALCGVAASYIQMVLARIGVGIGEAGCSPSAHSIISDYFPAQQRASVLSVYSLGIPLGIMFGAVLGGWLADTYSWRAAFVVLGIGGLLLAPIVKLAIREPPRGHSEPVETVLDVGAPPSTLQVATSLLRSPAFRHLCAGMTLAGVANYGINTFSAAYFVRQFGVSYTTVGLLTGAISGLAAGAGTLLGGYLADALGRRGLQWYGWLPAVGFALAVPLQIVGYLQNDIMFAVALLMTGNMCCYFYLGPTFGLTHNLVAPRMRATAIAMLYFVVNLIGLGGGPVLVGALIDTLGGSVFLDHPHALAMATRSAIIITAGVFLWSAMHYALSAKHIAREIKPFLPAR
jgi:MFS family permease